MSLLFGHLTGSFEINNISPVSIRVYRVKQKAY